MQKTIALLLLIGIGASAADQKTKQAEQKNFPIATQTLLNGVTSSDSRSAIKSVLMLYCPKDGMKGTGFVVSGGGIITTNSHVVGTCRADEMVGISAVSAVETEVETWGYPLNYQEAAPILSRGYVAGYTLGKDLQTGNVKNPPVRHLIVNGALNPGNSGGPLIDRANGKVIGIVVEKWRLFSPNVQAVIAGFRQARTMTVGGLTVTDENGVTKVVTNELATAVALKEIYDDSQVMIGEAISVSELNAFIKEEREALACASH